MIFSQAEARELGSDHIGAVHLLLGLAREERGVASDALTAEGVTVERVREALIALTGALKGSSAGQIPFTPKAKKALELSLREALSLGHTYIGTEHVLLGLVRAEDGTWLEVLRELGVEPEALRRETLAVIPPPGSSAPEREGEAPQDPDSRAAARASTPKQEPVPEEAIEAIPTYPDRPATNDELGRARLAEVLGERIRRVRGEDTEATVESWRARWQKRRRDIKAANHAGSFMVHVHAPWGAGKSSLLNFLREDLRNREPSLGLNPLKRAWNFLFRYRRAANPSLSRWIVVEFSAWEHQRLIAPWWWLLTAIQRSCARELWRIDRVRWARFLLRDLAWRLWNARAALLTTALLLGLAIVAWISNWFGLSGQSLTAMQAILVTAGSALALSTSIFGLVRGTSRWLAIGSAEGAVRFLKRAHDPLGVYRRRFRWLVRSSARPIAVFIDDLDRCRPDYVVELLEGIQTLFAAEPVTYVIAADRTWLCESFAKTYSEFKDAVGILGRPLGFLFLEKTFQISLEIPPMSKGDQARYWDVLIQGSRNGEGRDERQDPSRFTETFAEASTQEEVEARVKTLLEAEGNAHHDDVMVAAVRRMNAPALENDLEKLLREFAPLLEKNPRSMKRLINAYGIERDRLLRNGYLLTRTERRQLALFTILWLRWPQFAEHLRTSPADAHYCTSPSQSWSDDHPFGVLFADIAVRRLFDGTVIEERLDPNLLEDFPGRPPG